MAVRNHISTIKHNIRQQQAQLNSLENIVRSSPRPYPPELPEISNYNMATSSSPSSYVSPSAGTPTSIKRRSSHDVLLSLAGPESSLPLPKRDILAEESVREGIPAQPSYKRASSPTKSRGSSLHVYSLHAHLTMIPLFQGYQSLQSVNTRHRSMTSPN